MNKTSAKICNLNDILQNELNKIFIIPPYQRLYSWNKEQIITLLDDFRNCLVNDKAHFIGNIVVAKNEDNFELVDGQQRLSTIFFLCVYMCFKNSKMQKAEGDFENAYKFAFVNSEDNNSNNHKCRIHMPIREDDENAIWNYDFDKTNANIRLAFDYFDEYFKKADDCCNESLKKAELKNFCDFIFTNVKFNLVILGDQVELNKYFVRMNNTGVQLDGTDILKARLLKLISDNDKSQVTKYAKIFDECSQMNYFSDFGFVNNSENNNMIGKSQKIEEIIQGHKISKKEDKKKERAEFESIIDFPTFVLHVFKILSRQELEQKSDKKIFKDKIQISIKKDKFLENTWDKLNDNLDAEQAKIIINALQDYRIIFDTFVIKKKLIKDEDKAYYGFYNYSGNKLDSDKASLYDLATIQNYLRVARRGDNTNYHHFLTHYLEFCKNEIMSEEEISRDNCLAKLKVSVNTDNLRKYLKSIDDFLALKQFNMANNDLNNTTNLIDEINIINFGDTISIKDSLNDINEDKFSFLNYNNRGNHKVNLTYWFHRLEYYLLIGDYHTNQEFGANFEIYKCGYYFRNINSVEHILAQHEEDQTNNKIAENDLHSFGNLALISSSENSSLSNQGYEKKRIDFKNNKIISLKLFDVFENKNYQKDENNNKLSNPIWKEAQIKKHQEVMLGVLKNSFNSYDQIKDN